jgi:lipoyl(octanoyl) transferase
LFVIIKDLGLIDFDEAYALQERLAAGVAAGSDEETLLLLEHPPIYTIGSGGSDRNILDPSIRAVRINRGGDATFHGPGQLVGYPIINLARRGRDLHRYLRFLEELVIRIAAEFGFAAHRISGKTGVWSGSPPVAAKLASIAVGVRRWVTMHGFALNVTTDLSRFSGINPCGIVACPVTSMFVELGEVVSVDEIKERVAQRFEMLLDDLLPVDFGDIIKT